MLRNDIFGKKQNCKKLGKETYVCMDVASHGDRRKAFLRQPCAFVVHGIDKGVYMYR